MPAAQNILNKFVALIIKPAVLVMFALALLLFVWGIVVYIKNLGEGKNTEEGKRHMLFGILGMFIMLSVFGILSLISNTLGLGVNPNTGTVQMDTSRINSIKTPCFGAGC